MMNHALSFLLFIGAVLFHPLYLSAFEIKLRPDFVRPNPDGTVFEMDHVPDSRAAIPATPDGALTLTAVRNGYYSLHVHLLNIQSASYVITLDFDASKLAMEADLFYEWIHPPDDRRNPPVPDALIPVQLGKAVPLPYDDYFSAKNNAAFWLDLWIANSAQLGRYPVELKVVGKTTQSIPLLLNVLKTVVPDDDAIIADHNTYGLSWMGAQYPSLRSKSSEAWEQSDELFKLIQAYHRLFYEHRSTFHQLGTTHTGFVHLSFRPEISGEGENKHAADWTLFDKHYGPLLDGSAFQGTRRGSKPIPFIYTPFTPEWPAPYVLWGEKGYAVEFGNVVKDFDAHFREKNWTQTYLELFFNHKKRYRGFSWDGDETRFEKDFSIFRTYRSFMDSAIPSTSPVRWRFRADSSWSMEKQWEQLKGVINFWVLGEGMSRWYPEAPERLKNRGDIVWVYGESPGIYDPVAANTFLPLRVYITGVDGFIYWLTTSPSPSVWTQSDGESVCTIYPGDRFGIPGPIPSIRLKLLRNINQDVALLKNLEKQKPRSAILQDITTLGGFAPGDFWDPRPPIADTSPLEWSNVDIGKNMREPVWKRIHLGADYWLKVREYAIHESETLP